MAGSYKIASFNSCNLSFNSSSEKLQYIAEIIKDENFSFDIVAVQEVLQEGKAWTGAGGQSSIESEINQRFLKYNLPGWECKYCKPSKENSRTKDNRGEGFFFMWKRSSFRLAEYKEPNSEKIKVFEPRIINELTYETKKEIPPMARMPMYARFVANNNSMIELRLINVHLYEGGYYGFGARQEEFWTVINEIYTGIQSLTYGTGVKPYTIVMGDYNLIINDELAYKAEILDKDSPYIESINVNDDGYKIITRQDLPTSLRDPFTDENGEEQMPEDPYKNNYDHFSYDMDRFDKNGIQVDVRRLTMEECIKRSPQKYKTKELEYRKIISDHVPIVMEITF